MLFSLTNTCYTVTFSVIDFVFKPVNYKHFISFKAFEICETGKPLGSERKNNKRKLLNESKEACYRPCKLTRQLGSEPLGSARKNNKRKLLNESKVKLVIDHVNLQGYFVFSCF